MNYALIDNGIVTNIIWLSARNAGDFPAAVPCGERPVMIGDTYTDGVFYRGEEKVLTETEKQLADAQSTISEYEAALSAIEQALEVQT